MSHLNSPAGGADLAFQGAKEASVGANLPEKKAQHISTITHKSRLVATLTQIQSGNQKP